jgi:O-antigen ligase
VPLLYTIGILLLVFSWWQPMHLQPWLSWHSEMLAFFAILLMAAGVLRDVLRSGRKNIQIPCAIWPLLLLILIVTLQACIGSIGFRGDYCVMVFYIAMGVLALVVGFNIARQETFYPKQGPEKILYIYVFAGAVLVAAIGSIVLALTQTLNVWDSVNWINRTYGYRRPGGNLSQTNQLATLCVMGVASLIYLHEAKKLTSIVTGLILVVLVLGVSITESRSGAISFFGLMVWWFFRRERIKFITSRLLILCCCSFFLVCLWFWPKFIEYVHSGGSMSDFQMAVMNLTAGARLIVWPQLLSAVWERPWFGWGLGGVSTALNSVLHNYVKSHPFTYAHNIVLDMTVGIGIPLTMLFVIVTSIWLWRRLSGALTILSWYCVALIIPVGIHSMFEFPFAYAYFLIPGLFAAGLLEGGAASAKTFSVNFWCGAMAIFLLIAGLIFSIFEYISVEEDYRVARFESLKVGRTPADYERPTVHIFDQLSALSGVLRMFPTPGMDTASIELLRKVAMRFPFFATQNRYALALALNGDTEEAVRQLKVMRIMHGEVAFVGIRHYWLDLANNKYPQLRGLEVP